MCKSVRCSNELCDATLQGHRVARLAADLHDFLQTLNLQVLSLIDTVYPQPIHNIFIFISHLQHLIWVRSNLFSFESFAFIDLQLCKGSSLII